MSGVRGAGHAGEARDARGAPAAAAEYLLALRPLLWIPAIALFEAGRTEVEARPLPEPRPLLALAALLALLAAVHVANAWRDRVGDRRNRKGGAIASGAIGARPALLVAGGSLAVAAFAAATARARPETWWLLVAALLLGVAYTAPPIEAKRRAGFDLVAQALGYGVVAFLLGAAEAARPPAPVAATTLASLAVAAIPYALGIATVGVLTMLADRTGDEASGQRTTVVALGRERSVTLAILLATATAAGGLASHAWAPALWGIVAAAGLTLGRARGWLGGEGRAADLDAEANASERAHWNRAAVLLQVVFLLLLAPRAPLAVAAAASLGVATALLDRARGGAGYPFTAVRRDEGAGKESGAAARG